MSGDSLLGVHSGLRHRAEAVLRDNDLGTRTKASPSLYPHQWSWDSAFIAIGLARLDPRRAAVELASLFAAQWANGKLPHIVYNPGAPPGSYFPGGDHWKCAALTPDAPRPPPRTSGLCQPPVHAVAAARIWDAASTGVGTDAEGVRGMLTDLYPRLLAWHRYVARERDPEGSGLVTVFHPWESGLDNSPRWDAPLAAVRPGRLPPYPRADLAQVSDALERPTREEYDRYLWLVHSLRRARYDSRTVQAHHPFLVKDVLSSALFVVANEALDRLAGLVGAPGDERATLRAWRDRGLRALARCWDPELGLCLDYDLRARRALRARTVAGFALLVAGQGDDARMDGQLAALESEAFLAHPRLRWELPPSTSPTDPGFRPRSYWRGPVWPVVTWLLWFSLQRMGEQRRADRLRRAALDQLEVTGVFPEYVEPFDGQPLGSRDQSWTAAVALDWLDTVRADPEPPPGGPGV